MVLGADRAPISNNPVGCTVSATPYRYRLSGHDFVLWDTAGFSETDLATVDDMKAVAELYTLLKKLESGVSLLVFCTSPRINNSTEKSWKLFREIICQKKVPIVMVVTHLENEDSMDDWWTTNETQFRRREMNPCDENGSGVACVTAWKGRFRNGRYSFQEEYQESQRKVRALILDNHLREPWSVDSVEWFTIHASESTEVRCCGFVKKKIMKEYEENSSGVHVLASRWNISEDEAAKLARILDGC